MSEATRSVGEPQPTLVERLRASRVPLVGLLVIDAAIAASSLWIATLLRFEGKITPIYAAPLPRLIVLLVAARLATNMFFRLHRWSFRFSSLADGARIGLAGLFGTGLFMVGVYLSRILGPPRAVIVLELLISTAAMAVVRFSPRLARMYLADRARARKHDALRTVIVGAGAAGEMLLRDLQRSHEHSFVVVGFADDDTAKWGQIVGGKPVLGGINELPEIAEQHHVRNVLIAIPRLSGARIREILALCRHLKLRFKILPVSYVYLTERPASTMLQDLAPEDLLPREQVDLASDAGAAAIRGRRALVTGAAGSIGSEICRQLLGGGAAEVVLLDINENDLYLLARRFEREFTEASVTVEVADIRDAGRIGALFARHRPQDVFHAAAHKHVPLMEAAPCEAVKNNVLGTQFVAQAALAHGAERFVFVSTDKAVRPTSVMGASKRVGEFVVRAMAHRGRTRFCAVRFGNVLGSAGSVVPLFRAQIAAGGPVTVTDPEVRRYFMTLGEAVGLVLKAAYGDFGELCVLDMGEQIPILDLARHMITMAGLVPDVDVPIVFTGLRPGEKLFEQLLTEDEEHTSRVNEKILVADSPAPPADLAPRLAGLAEAAAAEDSSRVVTLLRQLVPSFQPSGLDG